ncbi:hypothetical protein J5N97_006443 [Dioscorea zingiberensis]|uniref:Aminotransferase-like plant mobile domain-containing protein n=1 Tax=Dioscorea zingiberensis TaxID=325984 RepID=A0A9D5DD40_9LILI|nr:hypothetical protein J5N97_006443 [Dioscorea zingiberensis]
MTSAFEVPGPVEPYVLTDQRNHRSEAVWTGELWIWERFPSFRPDVDDPFPEFDFGDTMSYGARSTGPLTRRIFFGDCLPRAGGGRKYGTAHTGPSMHIAEPHCPYRVMRQFNRLQHIPPPMPVYDNYFRRGRKIVKWLEVRAVLIGEWEERHTCIAYQVKGISALNEQRLREYRSWYWTVTRRYISPKAYDNIGDKYNPRPAVERALVSLANHVGRLRRKHEAAGSIPPEVFADFEELWRHYDVVAHAVDLREEPEILTRQRPLSPNASKLPSKRNAKDVFQVF